ncbi:GvpL/GvpF family gas vesicle protein, partial [Streptosporangium amethystogenes]|uniref:GvpL/GvpF family gas vesicle protein n=1 Tax=Streptosporangium amethystogenes TaxID=2002 RepID=UPI0004CC7B14
MAEAGTYLYAISQDLGRALPADVSGVAGAPVRAITHEGLVAYVSPVPLDEFGEEPLRRSLEDLDWVGETARAHHRVVEAVSQQAPTAPVRLVTVYSTEDQIRDLLHRRHDDFAAVLARITGRREWGVKAYACAAAADSPSAGSADSAAEPEDDRPGTAYLKRRRANLRDREETWRLTAERAEHIHATVAATAVASHRHRPQDPELSGREDPMVLNGAYLVDEDRAEEFVATVDGLRGQGIDVELTGPWAPYSFTALDLGPADRETSDDT